MPRLLSGPPPPPPPPPSPAFSIPRSLPPPSSPALGSPFLPLLLQSFTDAARGHNRKRESRRAQKKREKNGDFFLGRSPLVPPFVYLAKAEICFSRTGIVAVVYRSAEPVLPRFPGSAKKEEEGNKELSQE